MRLQLVTAGCFVAGVLTMPSAAAPVDITELLARVGNRVEQYFARAQSIVCTEIVLIESLSPNFLSEGGSGRELVYELRVSWDEGDGSVAPDVKVMRQLVKVDGRAPRPEEEPECGDPDAVAAEPLVMLLPGRQRQYAFTSRGSEQIDGRDVHELEYLSRERGEASVEFEDDCASVSLPGRSRGRVWVDELTGDVLRLDSQLVGTFEFAVPDRYRRRGASSTMVMERADTSIRYHAVRFSDPEELVVLPASVRSTTVFRNAPSPRMRMTRRFTNYRRFITGGRVLK